jgi:acetyl-CoA C-acetyltransferase
VTACCKETEVKNPSVIDNFAFDVPFQQLLGLDFTQAAALQAMSYMNTYGVKESEIAEVVVKARREAKDNPLVSSGGDVTVNEVLAAEMLSHPITSMERKPYCDGAVALILAGEERAKQLTAKPVWVTGFGSCVDYHNLGDRDLAVSRALSRAAGDAYEMAGIKDPGKEIDLFEIGDHYAYQFLLWLEGLGVSEKGAAAKSLLARDFDRGGKTPANPSGGLLGGVPRYVAGLNSVIEAFHQLRGEADKKAVEREPRKALAHGTSGPAGQHHCVILLERGF